MRRRDVITDRQLAMLVFVRDLTDEHDWPPSIEELCAASGLASKSTVHAHLENLERHHLINRGPGPRMLRITSQGWSELNRQAFV